MKQSLIIFSGLPGVGKSTLAEKLARELKHPLLQIDDVIGEIPANPDIEFWDSRVAVLMNVIETQLKIGISVIVDSVFMNTDRHHTQTLAHKYEAVFLPVYVFISDEKIWEERVRSRYEALNNPEVANWERIQHQRERFRAWEPQTALFVDSTESLDGNYQKVLNYAKEQNSPVPLKEIVLTQRKYH
jgi:predicted kinase